MTKFVRAELPDFEQAISAAVNESDNVYVMLFATPLVYEHVRQVPNSILVEAPVGMREEWKDLKNPYRLNKDTNISRIPTLIRWTKEGPQPESQRLVERDVYEVSKLTAFFQN
ncbi:hypothetical protein BC937DRAFT_91634 [Endogone sp. FLAS-F59071]|nr:hypothetical protein BC937DRAFT_91634 [Endogone sp. FLAS-F59071]|eukprot:RUS16073.1 hypothetical protein BC937DRAFT_91634 [Endogone sp. FLAS-F59071]